MSKTKTFEKGKDECLEIERLLWRHLLRFFQYTFYYMYYFYSLMQSVDIYQMVCHPFSYATHAKITNIMKYVAASSVICCLLAANCLVPGISAKVLLGTYFCVWREEDIEMFQRIMKIEEIYGWAKFVILRIAYTLVAIFLAIKTKIELNASSNLHGRNDKREVYQRIFKFSLLPLGINFLLLIPEILNETFATHESFIVKHLGGSKKLDANDLSQQFIRLAVTACTMSFSLFLYWIAFPILFPQLRMSLRCRENEDAGAIENQEGIHAGEGNEEKNVDGKREGGSGDSHRDGSGKASGDIGRNAGATEDQEGIHAGKENEEKNGDAKRWGTSADTGKDWGGKVSGDVGVNAGKTGEEFHVGE